MTTAARAVMVGATLVLTASCSGDTDETQPAAVTPIAEERSASVTSALPRGGCQQPTAPPNGTVQTRRTRHGLTASYACATGFDLVGDRFRRCQANGEWSGSAPTCAFALAGAPCGSCGGSYAIDGTCDIDTPANLGSPCNVGSPNGACANGGTIVCGGECQATDSRIGNATEWHLEPTPTGSWDWDCDGVVTTSLHPSPAPEDCASFTDADACETGPVVEYVTEDAACGHQATLFIRDCGWKTLGPTCLNTPAGHRVTFQQCR